VSCITPLITNRSAGDVHLKCYYSLVYPSVGLRLAVVQHCWLAQAHHQQWLPNRPLRHDIRRSSQGRLPGCSCSPSVGCTLPYTLLYTCCTLTLPYTCRTPTDSHLPYVNPYTDRQTPAVRQSVYYRSRHRQTAACRVLPEQTLTG